MKRHRLHTRVFEAWNPNQKCFRIERRAWRKAKVISTPVLLPPRLFIFHKSLSKRAQYFGIIGNGSVGQEERGEGKKTKKIIIKMSHRESPMSRESERKKKKKKNSEILLKSGGNPLPLAVPLFSPSTDPFSIPALRVQRYTSRLSWSNSPYTNIHSIVFNARREDLSSRSFGVSPGKVGCTY